MPLFPNRIIPPRPWEPLSDREWAALRPFVAARTTRGRKLSDERHRIEAFFWIAASGRPWYDLPLRYGRPDTVHRHFRRLARAGLWELLLRALAHPATRDTLEPLGAWICRAFRRASRIIGGMKAIVIARSVGMLSALKAHPFLLPDPELSDWCHRLIATVLRQFEGRWLTLPPDLLNAMQKLLIFPAGRARLPAGATKWW